MTGKGASPIPPEQRINLSANEAARMEFRLRKSLNDYSMREEKRLEDEKLRNMKQAARESLLQQKQLQRDNMRAEREVKREEFRLKREASRAALREEREMQQQSRRFWRDLSIGAIVGSVGGGAGFSGFARVAGGALGGGIAGLAGASRYSAGLIAEVVGEVMSLVVNPLGAVGGAAQPFYQFQNKAFAFGGGRDLERVLFPSGADIGVKTPPWMKQLGVTNENALQSMEQFGIPVQGDQAKFIANMRLLSLQRGTRNLPTGAIEGFERQLTGLGLQGPNAASLQNENTRAMLTVLTEANTKGLDNSKLLASMASSLSILESSSAAGASVGAMRDLLRMGIAGGTPGGVSGANAAASAQGVAANFSNILRNPMMTMSLMQFAEGHGGLRSEGSVKALIGDEMFNSLKSTASGRATIASAIQAAQQGYVASAIDLLSAAQAISPTRSMQIAMPFVQSVTGGITAAQPRMLSGMTGAKMGDARDFAFGIRGGGGGGRGLQKTPLTEAKAAAFIKAIFGVMPSSGQRSAAHNADVGGALNSMHISGEAADIPIVPGMTPDQMIGMIKGSGVPYSELFFESNRGHRPHIHWGWRPKMGKNGKPMGNIPMSGIPLGGDSPGAIQPADKLGLPSSFGAQAEIAMSNLNSAALTAATLVPAMQGFNDVVGKATTSLKDFTRILDKITGKGLPKGTVMLHRPAVPYDH